MDTKDIEGIMCDYPPGEECALCGGRCCKEHGCVLAPEDLMRALSNVTPAASAELSNAALPAAASAEPFDAGLPAAASAELSDAALPKEHEDTPSPVIPERGALLALLQDQEKGLYAIEYVSTPQGACFYVRMRHKCYTFIGMEAMGECAALRENGCMFSMEGRPKGGRMLKSSPDRRCVQHYTAQQMAADWKPYQELLSGIYREYAVRMKEDGTFDRCDEDYFAWLREKRTALSANPAQQTLSTEIPNDENTCIKVYK